MKPTKLPRFASVDTIDPTSGITNVIEPGETLKNTGWVYRQYLWRQVLNWLHRITYQWLNWFNDQMDAVFDPRDYGDGTLIGANIALAADAAISANKGYINLNGGNYTCAVNVDFHNIPILFAPGTKLTINTGIIITGLNIMNIPKQQIISCAIDDVPIIKTDGYVKPEWFGDISSSGTLYKAIQAADGQEILLTPGSTYVQESCEITQNVNLNGYGATIQGVNGSTEIFNIADDIDYFFCKGITFTFSTEIASSERYILQNWITPYTPGDEYVIQNLILIDNNFDCLRIRFCCSGKFTIKDNIWMHNGGTTKVNGEYIIIGTGTEDYTSLSPSGIISGNTMNFYPVDGSKNIITIDGSKYGVIIENNTISNANINTNAYLNLFTGGKAAKVINNLFINIQILRKQTETGKSDNPYPVKYDLIQGNHFQLKDTFRGTLTCIHCKGSWFQIKDNTFEILYNGTVGRCIHLTLEDVDTNPLTIQTSHLGIITGNIFDLSSAKTDSIGVARTNDADIGGFIIFSNNIQRGGGYFAQLGKSIAANNIWQESTNGNGNIAIDIDATGIAIGNLCTDDSETYIGDSFSEKNVGFNRTIGTTVSGGSNINADNNDLVLVNGTGNIGITGGKIGQKLIIVCSGGTPSFVHSSNLYLQNSENLILNTNEILMLIKTTVSKWVQLSTSKSNSNDALMGYRYGFETEMESAASDVYNILINKGCIRDYDNIFTMELGDFKKGVIASGGTDFSDWVVGNNNGGVASSVSIADDMWLHMFVIGNKATRVIDVGLDTSIIAANLKTDTGWGTNFCYQYIGSIYIYEDTGKYKIWEYTQIKDEVWFKDIEMTPTITANSWESLTLNNKFCPPDVRSEVRFGIMVANFDICLAPGDLNQSIGSLDHFMHIPCRYDSPDIILNNGKIITGTTQNIKIFLHTTGSETINLQCCGFKYIW